MRLARGDGLLQPKSFHARVTRGNNKMRNTNAWRTKVCSFPILLYGDVSDVFPRRDETFNSIKTEQRCRVFRDAAVLGFATRPRRVSGSVAKKNR